MWVASTKGEGILFMVLALLMLGTWPALFNLVERRGRLPTHTFLDYAITNYLVAIVVALTLGQIGSSTPETPNFTTQLRQNNGPSVGFAVAGGIFLCIGNLLTQYALAFVGLSVTETVESSITVVMGALGLCSIMAASPHLTSACG
jgi:drug/metabolite transporter (DMT)-like permease